MTRRCGASTTGQCRSTAKPHKNPSGRLSGETSPQYHLRIMSYHNLSDFLSELQDDGELRRVHVEVDPILEVSEIVDRLCKIPGGGPALLFERVRGSTMPLVVNLLGSQKRMCRALGVRSLEQVAKRGAGAFKPDSPGNWLQKLKLLPTTSESTSWPPQIIKTGACQQVVKIGRDVDLEELPALQHWPNDAGRFLTAGQVFTRHPVTLERNLESFPLQIRDRNSLGVHWNLHHEAYQVFREHQARGTQTPVAVAFGGTPLLYYLTTVPVPPKVDRLAYGGVLCGKSLELVKCRQTDLEVPAQAEIVLEGYIDPTEPAEQGGPFGDKTGFYRPPEEVVTLHVTAVTHRSNPILVYESGGPTADGRLLDRTGQRGPPASVDSTRSRRKSWIFTCRGRAGKIASAS